MLAPIPENTIRTASLSYGKGNLYLRLGDQINGQLSKLDSDLLAIQLDGYSGTFLAALTIIQFVERLTDEELTEALHRRIDLRYALHLPNPGPRIDPLLLCSFRRHVLKNNSYRLLLEEVFNIVYPILGANDLHRDLMICIVIKSLCKNTARASLVEAMFHAIEALSANHFTWLRQNALPHWYERYSHSLVMLNSGLSIRQKEFTMDEVQADIRYLLDAVNQSSLQMIEEVPEIKTLKSMWNQLLRDRPGDPCSYCLNNLVERR